MNKDAQRGAAERPGKVAMTSVCDFTGAVPPTRRNRRAGRRSMVPGPGAW